MMLYAPEDMAYSRIEYVVAAENAQHEPTMSRGDTIHRRKTELC
jgi:hypothetical protein